MPKVSIVLPTYNGAAFIRESIESVLSQTETDWELIIVNDASTDETLSICEHYASIDSRVSIISNEKNRKLPASLNVGFANSSGKYLTWTSDDNLYKPDALKVMSAYLEENPGVALVCCEYDLIDEDGSFLRTRFSSKGRDKPYYLLAECNVGACFMYTRSVYKKIGGYDTDFFCAEDYEYWLRIAASEKISYLRTNHYKYRMNGASLSATKADIVRKKTLEIRSKYLPIVLGNYDIPRRDLGYIYYLMWRYDMRDWRLISNAARINPFYLLRALFHWQKMTKRRLGKSTSQSVAA